MRGMYFLLQSYSQGLIVGLFIYLSTHLSVTLRKLIFAVIYTRGYNQHRVDLFSPLYGLMGETEEVIIEYCGSNKSIKK